MSSDPAVRSETPPADEPATDPRFQTERPTTFGDIGQDDAFATESHPEGLRYGERPRPPGSEHHGEGDSPDKPHPKEPIISVG